MPEGMMKAFGVESFDLSNLGNYLSTEQFGFVWPIITIIFLLSWAGGSLAGEIEKGTIEILLAQPITRWKLFLSRYLAGWKSFTLYCLLSILPIIPLAKAYNIDFDSKYALTMTVLAFLFGWAILSLAFFFSAVFSEKGKVYFAGSGLLVLMYVLNIVASLKESLSDLKYLSFFYYFNSSQALVHNNIYPSAIWVFLGCALGFFLAAGWLFNRRDIAV